MVDDDRDLFEHAIQDLEKKDIFEGKFGDEPLPLSAEKEKEVLIDHGEVQEVRELATMEQMFADVKPLNQSKLRHSSKPAAENVPEQTPPPPVQQRRKPQSDWERLAENSINATVIDLRNLADHVAFRTLGIEYRGQAVRIVYQTIEHKQVDKKALESWAIGIGVPYAFSPDASDDEGILIIVPDK